MIAPVGVTGADATDATPTPTAFAAVTVNVYGVPFANPDTVQDNGPETHTRHAPLGDAVTV